MAERSGGASRILACILVGLGVFLIVASILIPTYTVDKLKTTPLDLEVTTIAEPRGDVLVASSLAAGKAQVDHDVPIRAQRFITTEEPSDADKITLQAGQSVVRTDKPGDTGLLSATVDRVTLDRKTALPVDDPIGSIQTQKDQPAQEVQHTGMTYKFPFDVEQKPYPYFDVIARKSQDVNFVEETEINGLKVYHFNQVIEPVDLSKVVNSPSNKVTLPADTWGLPGGPTPVTLTRFYQNVRDVFVEPETGVIVDGREQHYQYYGRNPNDKAVTAVKFEGQFNEDTIEYQTNRAKDGIDKLSLFGRTLPIAGGILGLISVAAGLYLGLRGRKGPETSPRDSNSVWEDPSGPNATTGVIPRPDLSK